MSLPWGAGDTASTGVGTGLVVDEVRLGRPGKETLVANTYDQDACSIPGVDICEAGGASNAFLGTLTTTDSYQDGRLVSTRMNAYQGLNGRLSANRIGVDWAGVGQATNFLTKMSYDSSGALQYQTNPYLPNVDAGRTYEFGYRRDQFDGLREAGGVNFVPFGGTHVSYNVAGGLAELKFNNGVSTVIGTEAAQMYRPRSFTVQTAGGASVYWNSGTYQYDPSGNITAIGGQTFAYDLAGRLVNAQMLPQATAPTESTPNTVSFAFDPYGNIKAQDWSSSNPTRSAPVFMEFAARQYGPSGTVSRNRITDPDFDYDINGNLRKSNSGGLKHTMLWDARNRMTSVQTGFPGDSAGTTLEARYFYDASGYRTITNPDSGDGKPVVSLRDGAGQLIADYVYSPASARLILEKDYLYGLGQLLVERRRTSAPPTATTQSNVSSGGNYNLALTSGNGASSYTLDVRDESGNSSSIYSVTPNAQGAFSVPESSLFPDTTNLLRIKRNTGEAEPYSAPLSIAYSPGVTGQSTNTVRAIAISREGTNLVIRWSLAAADGKLTRLHFDRADGGGIVPLNQNALPASVTSMIVNDQALAVPCGDFRIERIVPGQSSGTMTEFGVGMPPSSSSQNLTIGNGGGCGEDPPPPPPGGGGPAAYTLADSFHHRDHLGNLRIETDSAGLVMRDDDGVVEIGRHDYYPFGTEMTADLGVGSRKRFTGHERDAATGFDYMLARYTLVNTARFTAVDPGDDHDPSDPQSWNKFSYVQNAPTVAVDPDGRFVVQMLGGAAIGGVGSAGFKMLTNLASGRPALEGTGKAFVAGAVGGAVTAVAGPVAGRSAQALLGLGEASTVITAGVVGGAAGGAAANYTGAKLEGKSTAEAVEAAKTGAIVGGVVGGFAGAATVNSQGATPVDTLTRSVADGASASAAQAVEGTKQVFDQINNKRPGQADPAVEKPIDRKGKHGKK